MSRSPTSSSAEVPASKPWSVRRRALVSLLVTAHLLAVVAAPMANPGPASPLQQRLAEWCEPYLSALFLYHGYRFFGPEPGPSHVVEYTVTRADGSTVAGRFPDRHEHWPRLLYHRWFMLSERVYEISAMPNDRQWAEERAGYEQGAAALEAEGRHLRAALVRDEFQQRERDLAVQRSLQRQLIDAIGHWLIERHDGQNVVLRAVERAIPPMGDVMDHVPLDDSRYWTSEASLDLGTVGTASVAELPPRKEPP